MAEKFEIDWGVGDVIRDFASLRDQLGSSGGTAGSLSLLGGALGVSDIRGAAEALHRATLSGLGAATASRYGIPIIPQEIGMGTDRGAMLIQALEGLRATAQGPGGVRAALADARNLNLEDWIGVVHLMDDQFQKIKQEALATADIYSPERIAQATMLNFEMARLNRAVTDLGVVLGSLVIPAVADAASGLADWVRGLTGQNTKSGGTAPHTRLGTSMDGLRQAVEQNTNTLRGIPGFYGGGMRARNALPPAFGIGTGQEIQRNLRSLSKALGSISFNF